MNNDFECLLQREIIDILIGDFTFKEKYQYRVQMPYYSTSDLQTLVQRFGLSSESIEGSRWNYMEALLKYTIQTNTTSDLLVYLCSFEQFKERLYKLTNPEDAKSAYTEIIQTSTLGINKHLIFNDKELRQYPNSFQVVSVGAPKKIESVALKTIDLNYIHQLSSRIQADLDGNNFDSVLGKSRTLVEEVLIYILEQKQELVIPKGDFPKLFNKVKIHLNIQQCREFDKRINAMLSGLEKIIQAVIEMRNSQSDSHGVGTNRINIRKNEAQLAVNCAITFADYIFSVYVSQLNLSL